MAAIRPSIQTKLVPVNLDKQPDYIKALSYGKRWQSLDEYGKPENTTRIPYTFNRTSPHSLIARIQEFMEDLWFSRFSASYSKFSPVDQRYIRIHMDILEKVINVRLIEQEDADTFFRVEHFKGSSYGGYTNFFKEVSITINDNSMLIIEKILHEMGHRFFLLLHPKIEGVADWFKLTSLPECPKRGWSASGFSTLMAYKEAHGYAFSYQALDFEVAGLHYGLGHGIVGNTIYYLNQKSLYAYSIERQEKFCLAQNWQLLREIPVGLYDPHGYNLLVIRGNFASIDLRAGNQPYFSQVDEGLLVVSSPSTRLDGVNVEDVQLLVQVQGNERDNKIYLGSATSYVNGGGGNDTLYFAPGYKNSHRVISLNVNTPNIYHLYGFDPLIDRLAFNIPLSPLQQPIFIEDFSNGTKVTSFLGIHTLWLHGVFEYKTIDVEEDPIELSYVSLSQKYWEGKDCSFAYKSKANWTFYEMIGVICISLSVLYCLYKKFRRF